MRTAAAAVLVLAGLASPAGAQSITDLTARCGDASGDAPWCAAAALSYQAVAAGLGLAAAAGSEIPGTSSTLGWRRGLGPRMALSARVIGARIPVPDLNRASSTRLPRLRSVVSGASLDAAVGLFDGVRLAPLHGGILALDVVASVGVLRLPPEDGFQGNNVLAGGIGARLGLLRESFDVPGISLSVMRRFLGEVRIGADGAPGAIRLESAVTSLRALIGKDLSAAGVTFGVGWDRYSGDVTLEGPFPEGRSGGVALAGPAVDRLLLFGAVSRTWQVIQVTGEIGWAAGFDEPAEPATMPFDAGDGSVFASLSLRITR